MDVEVVAPLAAEAQEFVREIVDSELTEHAMQEPSGSEKREKAHALEPVPSRPLCFANVRSSSHTGHGSSKKPNNRSCDGELDL